MDQEKLLKDMFSAAVARAQPAINIHHYLPERPTGRALVVGAGKASSAMASALESHWAGALEGLVVTQTGYATPCNSIEIVEASHPVPDETGQQAAKRILDKVTALGKDDLLICLISGGGSALLSLPPPGISFEDKQAVNRALLKSGAPIRDMNCLRKHLSLVKGGRLAVAAAPARVVTLLISDVPGDDPADIASGPTVADPTTIADALKVIERYQLKVPQSVIDYLETANDESPKPNDPRLDDIETHIIAAPRLSLAAAAKIAEEHSISTVMLGDSIEGDAADVAGEQADLALKIIAGNHSIKPPCVLLSGGETTVVVNGEGRGGRNAQFGLALAVALQGNPNIYGLACDTDGIDGTENNAGVVVTPNTLKLSTSLGLDAKASLLDNDGYGFFEAVGGLVVTGPTLTNVNDFRVILVEEKS